MNNQLIQFLKDEEGATAIEYGLIAGLIAVVIIAALTGIGDKLVALFDDISQKLPAPAETGTGAGG